MIAPSTRFPTLLLALGAGLCVAEAAAAQVAKPAVAPIEVQTPAAAATPAPMTPAQVRARAATSSLNTAPAQTRLTPHPNAAPPLTAAERLPTQRPPAASSRIETQGEAQTPSRGRPRPETDPGLPATATSADPQMEEPEAIPLALGYYVRGDMGCNQVWPGEGDLAWLTATSFTIDFGGCEPGQFIQTAPQAWRETQQCRTELGGDAGGYEVTYQVTEAGTLLRRAQLAIDGRVEQDVWTHCATDDVPVEARFNS